MMNQSTLYKIHLAANSPELTQAAYKLFCSHRGSAWSMATFTKAYQQNHSLILTRCNSNKEHVLLGYILVSSIFDEAEIEDLCIVADERHSGLATLLFNELFERLKTCEIQHIMLEVADGNNAAQGLYAKLGFIEVGRRKAYYQDANGVSDAFVLKKTM